MGPFPNPSLTNTNKKKNQTNKTDFFYLPSSSSFWPLPFPRFPPFPSPPVGFFPGTSNPADALWPITSPPPRRPFGFAAPPPRAGRPDWRAKIPAQNRRQFHTVGLCCGAPPPHFTKLPWAGEIRPVIPRFPRFYAALGQPPVLAWPLWPVGVFLAETGLCSARPAGPKARLCNAHAPPQRNSPIKTVFFPFSGICGFLSWLPGHRNGPQPFLPQGFPSPPPKNPPGRFCFC